MLKEINNRRLLIAAVLLHTVTVVFVAILAQRFFPYGGRFPYKDLLPTFGLPSWLSAWANFDGLHYINIAQSGYAQYEQAFFPLYPLLIKFVAFLFFQNHLAAGLVISNICFVAGLYFIIRLLRSRYSFTQTRWFLIFLCTFPTAFFFHAVYTESLFFMFFSATLFFLQKKRWGLVALCAVAASTTRLMGIFLFIPIGIEVFQTTKQYRPLADQPMADNNITIKSLFVIVSPILGFALYALYLWASTGNPFYFFTSQPAFGANRSTNIILLPQVYYRYFRIFLVSTRDLSYFVAGVEFLLFTFCFLLSLWWSYKSYIRKQWFAFSIGLLSIINIGLPSLTGTLSSVPRYALISLAPLLLLATSQNTTIKICIAVVGLLLQALLLTLFIQGYFVS